MAHGLLLGSGLTIGLRSSNEALIRPQVYYSEEALEFRLIGA